MVDLSPEKIQEDAERIVSEEEQKVMAELEAMLRDLGETADTLKVAELAEKRKHWLRTGQGYEHWMIRPNWNLRGLFWLLCPVCNTPNFHHSFTGH